MGSSAHVYPVGMAPLVIGHRGAPGYVPEHTRFSYELAISQGADAIEPDVVASRDGVLVVRHENEISGTTDVADRPEYADRRTTKRIGGRSVAGWFTEDFTWAELARLTCRERIPKLRPDSARSDGAERMLRLDEVLEIGRAGGVGVVVEIKHAAHFAALGIDLAALTAAAIDAAEARGSEGILVESFEPTALERIRPLTSAPLVQLIEKTGSPEDGSRTAYREMLEAPGLAAIARGAQGISVHKSLLLADDDGVAGPGIVERARALGLDVFTWTCRPENAFLEKEHRSSGGRAVWGDWRAEWARIAQIGVAGAFVDHPDLGVQAFG